MQTSRRFPTDIDKAADMLKGKESLMNSEERKKLKCNLF